MKFFFPDSHDHVDPSFDFVEETRNPNRIPQRDDLYAHEILDPIPYQGVLISKGIVDGLRGSASAKFSMGQRRRFTSLGGRGFFRLPDHIELMGDCGAFTYRSEDVPPYSVDEVLEFYDLADVDYGISLDHVILAYEPDVLPGMPGVEEHERRQEITLEKAAEFFKSHKKEKLRFKPMGVAQGWSPASYAYAVKQLQKIGYDYIALGGMVALKTPQILTCLDAIDSFRKAKTGLHLLGVTRVRHIPQFAEFGVISFDSTSPLMQGLKDDDDNYWGHDRNYSSIALPDSEKNPRMSRLVAAGRISSDEARKLEGAAFEAILAYGEDKLGIRKTLDAVCAYEQLDAARKDRRDIYARALGNRPWEACECAVCADIGIHVMLKRSAARNRRRGFHNLHVFAQQLQRALEVKGQAEPPAPKE